MTLHTDLKHLNESGRIVRVHGGARSAEIVAGAEDFFPSGFNGIESKSKQSLKRPLPCFKRIELSFWIPALQQRSLLEASQTMHMKFLLQDSPVQ